MIGLGAVVVALTLVLVVCLVVIKKHNAAAATSGTSNAGSSSSGNIKTPVGVLIGGDGSTVTTDSGQTFTYTNSFGGYCEFPSFFATKPLLNPSFQGFPTRRIPLHPARARTAGPLR